MLGKTMKPTALFCYMCGREFGSSSLPIHLNTCGKDFLAKQEVLPPKLRLKVPNPPNVPIPSSLRDEAGVKAWNDAAWAISQQNRNACPWCKRKFGPDQLASHLNTCPQKGESSELGPKVAHRPRMLMCYICGREFGSLSLPIHQKQCIIDFQREQEKLPKSQRRPLPTPENSPFAIGTAGGKMSQKERDEYNEQAFQSYKDNLTPCPNCGRRFAADRLPIHLRSCKPGHVLTPLRKGSAATSSRASLGGSDASSMGGGEDEDMDQPAPSLPAQTRSTAGRSLRPAPSRPNPQGSPSSSTSSLTSSTTGIRRSAAGTSRVGGRGGGRGTMGSTSSFGENDQDAAGFDPAEPSPEAAPPPPARATGRGASGVGRTTATRGRGKPVSRPPAGRGTTTRSTASSSSTSSAGLAPSASSSSFDEEVIPTKKSSGGGGGGMDIPEYEAPTDLVECSRCGRHFSSDRIAKHQKVCKGPSEMKTHTTDLPPPPKPSAKPAGGAKPQWQKDHEQFIQAMRAAKQVAKYEKEGRLNELPPPPPDPHDDYKQCPHCGRRFAPLSYDRHVPKCANVINKPKPPPRRAAPVSTPSSSTATRRAPVTSSSSSSSVSRTSASISTRAPVRSSGYGSASSSTRTGGTTGSSRVGAAGTRTTTGAAGRTGMRRY